MLSLLDRALPPGGEPRWNGPRRIALYRHPTGVREPARQRSCAELVYMVRGSTRHRIGGNEVTLGPGELLLLGQNTPQELLPPADDAIAVSFFMKPEFFSDILAYLGTEASPLREFVLKCLGQETPYGYLHFRVGGVRQVANLMENLLLHLLEHPDSRRAIPLYTVGLLFVQLLEESDKLTMGIREQQTVLGTLRYLEHNYRSGSLTDAAKLLHCDVAWLSREIKRRTGRTYTELLQERRLHQAAWLLEHTTQRVSDIALSVGYENVSYFHRIFREHYGMSPKKYRDHLPLSALPTPRKKSDRIAPELPLAERSIKPAIFSAHSPTPMPSVAFPTVLMVRLIFIPVSPSGTGKTLRLLISSFFSASNAAPDIAILRYNFPVIIIKFSIPSNNSKKRIYLCKSYLLLPRKKSASVPGPECAPITGPTSLISISVMPNSAVIISASFFASS